MGTIFSVFLVLLLVGAYANRWWVALLPPGAYVPLLISMAGRQPDGHGELGWELFAYVYGIVALAASAVLLAGFGLRRLAAGMASEESVRPPGTPVGIRA